MHIKRKVIRLTHVAQEIAAFATADGGNKTTVVTATGHGLSDGDLVDIHGTTNYDGTGLVISEVSAVSFEIETDYVADDGVGTWIQKQGSTNLAEDAEQYDEAVLYTTVTAHTSGSVVVSCDTSPDDGTTWYELAAGASLNSISTQRTAISAPIGRLVRPVVTFTEAAGACEMAMKVYLELARTGG